MDPEIIQILDSHVYIAFIRHNRATQEVWWRDYLCVPLNKTTVWWTGSPYIHVQLAFKVRLSGGERLQPEETYMSFSVDNKRKIVHAYPDKQWSDEYAWKFIKYNLDKTLIGEDGERISQIEAAYLFCEEQVGKPATVMGMILGNVCGWNTAGDDSFYCTKLVLDMLHEVGELTEVSSVSTSPGQLYRILSTQELKHGAAHFVPHPRTFDQKEILF